MSAGAGRGGACQWGGGGGAGAPRRDVEVPEGRGGVGIKPAGDAGGARRSPAPTRVALKCGGSCSRAEVRGGAWGCGSFYRPER